MAKQIQSLFVVHLFALGLVDQQPINQFFQPNTLSGPRNQTMSQIKHPEKSISGWTLARHLLALKNKIVSLFQHCPSGAVAAVPISFQAKLGLNFVTLSSISITVQAHLKQHWTITHSPSNNIKLILYAVHGVNYQWEFGDFPIVFCLCLNFVILLTFLAALAEITGKSNLSFSSCVFHIFYSNMLAAIFAVEGIT